jgi:hypothetical protein
LASASLFLATGSPAKAALCLDGTLTAVQTAGSCTDAVGFTFALTSFSGFSGADIFSFQSAGNNFSYSVQGAGAWSTSGLTLNYTATAPTGKQFNFYTSNLSSSNNPPLDAGNYTVASATQPSAISTFAPPLQANGGLKIYSPKITTDIFTGTLNVTGGTISSVTGVVASQIIPPPTSSVPGPLPLLGAVAAFSFSRKMRNRIKAAV